MESHPWGRIFGAIIKDNAAMARRLKLDEPDISTLCREFVAGLDFEKERDQKAILQAKKDIAKDIIQSELSSAASCLGVCPPPRFAVEPVLRNSRQRAEALQTFMPTKRQFSGYSGNQGGPSFSLEEYLETLNRAQRHELLSRSEFEDFLLQTSTGSPHQLIFSWLRKGQSIEQIYKALSLNFDKRLHPEEAKSKLNALKAAKNQTLAMIESTIMKLAQRASELIPAGPSREQVYEIEAGTALLRSLPPTSLTLATNTYQSLSAKLGRVPEFGELIQALDRYTISINSDIAANGQQAKAKDNTEGGKQGKKKGGNAKKTGGQQQATAFFVANQGQSTQASNTQGGKSGGNTQGGQQQKNNSTHFNQSNGQTGQPSHGQSKGNQGGKNKNGKGGGWKGNSNQATASLPYCSLCGSIEHTSASGCDRMRNNTGNVVKVMPTQAACTLCPTAVSPRLHHPESLCPWRKQGCMAAQA
jgi:hypothetical protein